MKKLILILFILKISNLNSQVTKDYYLIEEYEFNIGYLNIQGDMGKPDKYFGGFSSSGIDLGAKFYIYFNDPRDNTRSYFAKHLKYNMNIHLGYVSLTNEKGLNASNQYAEKINAIKGNLFLSKIGFDLEYHLTDLKYNLFFESEFFTHFDPYFFGGLFYSYSNVEITSDLGDYNSDTTILPPSYIGRIKNGSNNSLGLNYGVGIRYKLNDQVQFSISTDWLYFGNDYIDGLSPNPDLVKNLHDDWLFQTNLGVIIFLTKEYE